MPKERTEEQRKEKEERGRRYIEVNMTIQRFRTVG
jgi:hypothetical protein